MSGFVSIETPGLFEITDGEAAYCCGDQEWYRTEWQRRAGCGPTTCSHQMWYLSKKRLGYAALCPYGASDRPEFLRLMEDVWHYVTPGRMGVNSTSIFARGALRYGQDRSLDLHCRILDIPLLPHNRPGVEEMTEFLAHAFKDDLPVAFLNLSNGSLHNLDNWHWVLLASIDPETQTAVVYDQCRRTEIDLAAWLQTTKLGGGFVAVEPAG